MQHRPITIISFARAVTVRVCVSTVVEVCAIGSNIALQALMEVLAYFTCTLAVVTALAPSLKGYAGHAPGAGAHLQARGGQQERPARAGDVVNIITTLLLAKDAFGCGQNQA